MAGREADGARILVQVMEAERLRVSDQHAENAPAARQVADRRMCLGVDPRRQEPLEPRAAVVDDAECGVLRAGEGGSGLDESLQEHVERQLGGDRDGGYEQGAQAGLAGGDGLHSQKFP